MHQVSGGRGEKQTPSLASFYSLIFLVVAIDQMVKFLALKYLSFEKSLPVLPDIFHLTLVQNTGIAFGIFRRHESILFILITVSIAVLFVWGIRVQKDSRLSRWGMILILGGAVGNWIDRVRFGSVIDFLDFRIWPVFNVADSAITIGVCLFLFLFIKKT
jgi:signal peptidase II